MTLHNLKQMAATTSVYEESGFIFLEELEVALAAASAGLQETTGKLKAMESTLGEKGVHQDQARPWRVVGVKKQRKPARTTRKNTKASLSFPNPPPGISGEGVPGEC